MLVASGLCRSVIGEPEPISLNDIAYGHQDVSTELWAPATGLYTHCDRINQGFGRSSFTATRRPTTAPTKPNRMISNERLI